MINQKESYIISILEHVRKRGKGKRVLLAYGNEDTPLKLRFALPSFMEYLQTSMGTKLTVNLYQEENISVELFDDVVPDGFGVHVIMGGIYEVRRKRIMFNGGSVESITSHFINDTILHCNQDVIKAGVFICNKETGMGININPEFVKDAEIVIVNILSDIDSLRNEVVKSRYDSIIHFNEEVTIIK